MSMPVVSVREARVHPISLLNLEEDNEPVSSDAVRIAEEFDGARVQALWTLIFSVQSRTNQHPSVSTFVSARTNHVPIFPISTMST